ncbi:MAG: ATP-dependent zinc metalloprotease FtsH [Pirellulaceae bacterium]|nr:ATP-dependent zinc metalloprotease FtsH [Pirellulaceae bacterium]
MENQNQGDGNQPPRPQPVLRRSSNLWLILLAMAVLAVLFFTSQGISTSTIEYYNFFVEQVEWGNVVSVTIGDQELEGVFDEPPYAPKLNPKTGQFEKQTDRAGQPITLQKNFRMTLPRSPESKDRMLQILEQNQVAVQFAPPDNTLLIFYMLAFLVPIGLFVFFWLSYRRTRDQIMGGGFLSGFSKSPAKRYEAMDQAITFKDVAGLSGVKADLMEIVEYLRNPAKFQRLGGRVPKGVLLNGPPGTGKTLLARAVAGEAGVPYYSVSGSEFIQMFVGVGASRVRDLFKTAKDNSPSIVFIDEIDAVGRQRGAGLGGGHDEREQTLNQILSEMDGFTQNDSVIVLAATNRPDVLDPALLRPGRFDRHITVGRPTQKGRVEIFKVHVRNVPLADNVDLDRLASATVGLTGADIRNIVNEAALWAARQDKNNVDMSDFEYARDKILMGAKREEVLLGVEKEKTAYHEAGHTLTAWHLPGANRVHKVTIIPRGRSLGSTQTLPAEDRLSMSESELRDHLIVLLGGRAAERLIYNETTVGAENDLERATGMARRMVTHWGMSERLGPVSYKLSEEDPFLGREIHQQRQFSEHTMELIDEEVAKLLHGAAETSQRMLAEQREELEKLTRALLEKEELTEREIAELIGPSVHGPPRADLSDSSWTDAGQPRSGKPAATTPPVTTPAATGGDSGNGGDSDNSGARSDLAAGKRDNS